MLVLNIDGSSDGIPEVFMLKDAATDATWTKPAFVEYLMIEASTLQPYDYFSGDGFLNITLSTPALPMTVTKAYAPIAFQADDTYSGNSPYELLLTSNWMNITSGHEEALRVILGYDGTIYSQERLYSLTTDYYGSQPILTYDAYGLNGNVAVCWLTGQYGGAGTTLSMQCVDGSGTSEINLSVDSVGGAINDAALAQTVPFSGDLDGDGFHDVATGIGIFSIHKNKLIYNYSGYIPRSNVSPIPAIGADNVPFLVWMDATETVVLESLGNAPEPANLPPVLVGIPGQSPSSPVCENTTVLFTATQGTTYTNDFSTDLELLQAACGNRASFGELVTGTANDTTISVSCLYNRSGSWNARVYLQDTSNLDSFGQYADYPITVIPGIPGSTCNVGSITEGGALESQAPPGGVPSPSANPFIQFLNVILGGDANFKLLAGLAIVIAAGILTAVATQMAGLAIFVAILAFIACVALTLIPVWFLILALLGAALLGFLVAQFRAGGG
jgi:hypothetical protein